MSTKPPAADRTPQGDAAARAPAQPVLTVVLPIFNEEKNLGRLFAGLDDSLRRKPLVYRIVAVDDGSTDGTADVLAAFQPRVPLQVLRHAVNQGLGVAIRSGLMEALRLSSAGDIIVTMDADESHTPSLIARMLEAIDAGHDVVIASRFQPGSRTLGVPLHRRALSVCASVIFRMLFPTPGVRDFTCGYRAYRASALQQAVERYGDKLFEFDGFQCMVDLLLKLRAVGAKFAEVPIVLRYDFKLGQSKMRVFRTAIRTLQLAARRRLGR
jgi:dolichol-phosphate mannosyltransferase